MRIGMIAAQNDETGDQGLARTVDKISYKQILRAYPTWDFERRSGDSRVFVFLSAVILTREVKGIHFAKLTMLAEHVPTR